MRLLPQSSKVFSWFMKSQNEYRYIYECYGGIDDTMIGEGVRFRERPRSKVIRWQFHLEVRF